MSGQVFLIRYGEIALKSKYVRRMLVRALISNIKTHFANKNLECFITSDYGRIYLYSDDHTTAVEILRRVFGIVSFSLCEETSSELSQILEDSKKLVKTWIKEGMTFAVRARRVGTHPYSSQSLAGEIGAAILDEVPGLSVDLDNPDAEILVEVRHDKAYLYKDSEPGLGGFPLGTQGTVIGFVEKDPDILATWLMMKRGCKVHVARATEDSGFDVLRKLDPGIRFHECKDLDALLGLSRDLDVEGIVLGWDLEKTLRYKLKSDIPIFYPLVGLSEREKERLMKHIQDLKEHTDDKTHNIA